MFAIALGGALGAIARYWLTELSSTMFGAEFPYGTLIVNVLGSLCLGFAFVLLSEPCPCQSSVALCGDRRLSRRFHNLLNFFSTGL